MARIVSLTVLTTLIVVLGITFFRVIAPFLLPLFLAGVTALVFQPVFQYFVAKCRQRVRLAAGITTACILMILTVPLLLATFVAAVELYQVASQAQKGGGWVAAAERMKTKLEESAVWKKVAPWFPEIPESEQWPEDAGELARLLVERTLGFAGLTLNRTLGILTGTVSLAVALLMYIIALYYFLADGPALLAASEQLIPVHVDYQRQLRQRFDQVVRAVMTSTFLAASVQALLTATALRVLGFRHFFLFLVIGALTAMIPLAGTWLVWGPCALWLAFQGHWASAIGLTLFGIVVVGAADNVIRTWVLNSDARLHALLAFISVMGGVQALGLWGVFIGPVIATCLHALIQIFNAELKAWSREAFAIPAPAAASPPAGGSAPPPAS